jgi:aminoglycoside phosphotransferase (APT) family kinase protein
MAGLNREVMRQSLEAWLAGRLTGASEVRLSPLRFPQGTGNSAETTFADLTYRSGGASQTKTLVFRRQLQGSDLFLDATLELPYNMMRALERHPAVPAPRAIGMETDSSVLGSPFLVMENVAGRIVDQVPNYNVRGWVAELAPPQRAAVWLNAVRTLAGLHSLDWRDGFEFLSDPARGRPGLDQYLHWVRDWYRWAQAGRTLPVADAALAHLFDQQPANTEVCVLWGDPTPANTLFKPDLSVSAIIDFEMAAMGPGEVDLAWWLGAEENFSTLAGVARLEGLPDRAATIAFYEEARGRQVASLDYYFMLAYFRMNIVVMRFSDRLINAGRMAAGTDVLTNNPSTATMANILGLPVPQPGEGYALMLGGMAGAASAG